MRGTKAKMLRANAAKVMSDGNPRRQYRKLKQVYTRLAAIKSQNPAPLPLPRKPKVPLGTGTHNTHIAPIVLRPLRAIRARIRDEHTTIGNLTNGRVDYIKKASRILAKIELNQLALGVSHV